MAAGDDRQVGVERLLFLRSLATTRPDGPEGAQLAAAMRDVHFRRGQQLFAIGDPSGDIYFLVKGSVRMAAPDTTPWDFEAPAVVGALDSFAGRPRTRRGVATSDTHALVLAHTDWLAVLEEHFDFARESVLRLSGALWRLRLGVPGDGGYPPPPEARAPLATGLGLLEKTLALREMPLFRGAGVQATLRLVELAEEIELRAGDTLCGEGDPCEVIDIVTSGLVAVACSDPAIRAAFGPGALVGGAGPIGVDRFPFTAHAPEGAVVLRLRKDDVLDVMEDHFELTRAILLTINAEREEIMRKHGAGSDNALRGAPQYAPRPARRAT
ncbi:MAG: cyclic nucleotide-binding domain-containing protein [Minicystis sp.]